MNTREYAKCTNLDDATNVENSATGDGVVVTAEENGLVGGLKSQ